MLLTQPELQLDFEGREHIFCMVENLPVQQELETECLINQLVLK